MSTETNRLCAYERYNVNRKLKHCGHDKQLVLQFSECVSFCTLSYVALNEHASY